MDTCASYRIVSHYRPPYRMRSRLLDHTIVQGQINDYMRAIQVRSSVYTPVNPSQCHPPLGQPRRPHHGPRALAPSILLHSRALSLPLPDVCALLSSQPVKFETTAPEHAPRRATGATATRASPSQTRGLLPAPFLRNVEGNFLAGKYCRKDVLTEPTCGFGG